MDRGEILLKANKDKIAVRGSFAQLVAEIGGVLSMLIDSAKGGKLSDEQIVKYLFRAFHRACVFNGIEPIGTIKKELEEMEKSDGKVS